MASWDGLQPWSLHSVNNKYYGNRMILSAIWNTYAQVIFFKD